MRMQIRSCLGYFSQFGYNPTLKELHRYVGGKISRKAMESMVDEMVKKRRIIKLDCSDSTSRYTLGGYRIDRKRLAERAVGRAGHSQKKIEKVHRYVSMLSCFGCIDLIGLSGSTSMMNAKKSDDIDLFIIARARRMWSARAVALLLAQLLGVRRAYGQRKVRDKVCLNLFFDGSDLGVLEHKQCRYVAHEALQMKPLAIRGDVYERYLQANKWVFQYFPNAKGCISSLPKNAQKIAEKTDMASILMSGADRVFGAIIEMVW